MADEGKGKKLLTAGAAAAGTGAAFRASGALTRRADEARSSAVRRERVRENEQRKARAEQRQGSKKGRPLTLREPTTKDPTRGLSPRQSKEFREFAQKKRRSAKAQAARARTLGSKTLGTAGVALNAPGAIKAARSIEAEGGPFAARFGKFVERILGAAPSQHLPRPPTKKERTIQY